MPSCGEAGCRLQLEARAGQTCCSAVPPDAAWAIAFATTAALPVEVAEDTAWAMAPALPPSSALQMAWARDTAVLLPPPDATAEAEALAVQGPRRTAGLQVLGDGVGDAGGVEEEGGGTGVGEGLTGGGSGDPVTTPLLSVGLGEGTVGEGTGATGEGEGDGRRGRGDRGGLGER